ncbi:HpcH/HpaI aldolase family protein [Citricoccus zhacaiensis]
MSYNANPIKQALREGRPVLGIEFMTESHRLIEIAGWSGFDYIQFDMEHTPYSFSEIEGFVRTAHGAGLTSIVRVAETTSTNIRRVLETGAQGVIFPQVKGAAEVRDAIAATRYAPAGTRGMCPVTRVARFNESTWDEYLKWAGSELLSIALIENQSALEDIDEICAVEGLDAVGFGAGDMGQSLGVGARGLSAPAVRAALERVSTAAVAHDLPLLAMPVITADPFESVRSLISQGTLLVTFDADALMFSRQCSQIVQGFQAVTEDMAPAT